jgi:hypothetical protein
MTRPSLRVDAVRNTTFVREAGAVEILRSDQPACRVPYEDMAEFIRQSNKRDLNMVLRESPRALKRGVILALPKDARRSQFQLASIPVSTPKRGSKAAKRRGRLTKGRIPGL